MLQRRKLTKKNLWSIRPGTGIPSRYYDKVIGLKAKTNIKSGNLLKLNQLEKKFETFIFYRIKRRMGLHKTNS